MQGYGWTEYVKFKKCVFGQFFPNETGESKFEANLLKKGVRLYWPGEGYWRTLGCGGFEQSNDANVLITGDVFGHECKEMDLHYFSDEAHGPSCPSFVGNKLATIPNKMFNEVQPESSSNKRSYPIQHKIERLDRGEAEREHLVKTCMWKAHGCYNEEGVNLCEARAKTRCALPHNGAITGQ